jgi:hypothetical protein
VEQGEAIPYQDSIELLQEVTRIVNAASESVEMISLLEGTFAEQVLQTLTTMLADDGWCEHHRRSLEDLQSATDPVETVGAVTFIRWVLRDRPGTLQRDKLACEPSLRFDTVRINTVQRCLLPPTIQDSGNRPRTA